MGEIFRVKYFFQSYSRCIVAASHLIVITVRIQEIAAHSNSSLGVSAIGMHIVLKENAELRCNTESISFIRISYSLVKSIPCKFVISSYKQYDVVFGLCTGSI